LTEPFAVGLTVVFEVLPDVFYTDVMLLQKAIEFVA